MKAFLAEDRLPKLIIGVPLLCLLLGLVGYLLVACSFILYWLATCVWTVVMLFWSGGIFGRAIVIAGATFMVLAIFMAVVAIVADNKRERERIRQFKYPPPGTSYGSGGCDLYPKNTSFWTHESPPYPDDGRSYRPIIKTYDVGGGENFYDIREVVDGWELISDDQNENQTE